MMRIRLFWLKMAFYTLVPVGMTLWVDMIFFQTSYDSISQKWNEPKNLGYPINTVAEDTYFTIDGKLGYLSSTRTGGFGSLDVYRVFLFNKVSVAGQLLDSASNPIADAEVNIKYDSTNLRTYTDGNGAYELLVSDIQRNESHI